MSHKIRLVATIIILLVVGTTAYGQRVRVSDWWSELRRPSVPAVTFEEVKEQTKAPEPKPPVVSPVPEPQPKPTPAPKPEPTIVSPTPEPKAQSPEPTTLPSSFNLAVPFTPQAPFANWDETHEETCEEASVYMTHLYFEGAAQGLVAPATAEAELLRMVEAEKKMFGYFEDTTAEEVAQFTRSFYGYTQVEVIADPTVEDIKRHIAAGRPVIVPAAGRLLGNPYFTPPGPDYHMLVIRGYTKDTFIVNDPGTRRGEAFTYPIETIMNAMHDWNPPNDITLGRKAVIVIYPK